MLFLCGVTKVLGESLQEIEERKQISRQGSEGVCVIKKKKENVEMRLC